MMYAYTKEIAYVINEFACPVSAFITNSVPLFSKIHIHRVVGVEFGLCWDWECMASEKRTSESVLRTPYY